MSDRPVILWTPFYLLGFKLNSQAMPTILILIVLMKLMMNMDPLMIMMIMMMVVMIYI